MTRSPKGPLYRTACGVAIMSIVLLAAFSGCKHGNEKEPDPLRPTPPPRASDKYAEEEQAEPSFWSWLPFVD